VRAAGNVSLQVAEVIWNELVEYEGCKEGVSRGASAGNACVVCWTERSVAGVRAHLLHNAAAQPASCADN
jgi:hypothetical protein